MTLEKHRVKAVIFDADHTLYTPASDEAYEKKFEFLAKETGKKADGLRRAWDKIIERTEESADPGEWERKYLIEQTLEAVGAPVNDQIIEDAYSVFWETVATNTTSDDGISHLVRQLQEAGYQLAIATDEFPEPLHIKLNAVFDTINIEQFFDPIITPEDTGTQKPSKAFYRPILDAFEITADEAAMVGDSWIRDLAPAQELGMQTVLVGDSDPEGSPDAKLANVTDLSELLL